MSKMIDIKFVRGRHALFINSRNWALVYSCKKLTCFVIQFIQTTLEFTQQTTERNRQILSNFAILH